MAQRPFLTYSLLIGCLAMAVILYLPGLNGGYYFDDAHVLVNNAFIKINNLDSYTLLKAADSFTAGGRELSMLSFALNYYFFGDATWWFKFFNLILHCLNGAGLFFLANQLVSKSPSLVSAAQSNPLANYFPLFVTGLWLVHPINLIPVLYISQRMALLASFFIIYGLIFYVWARSFITSATRKVIYIPLGIAGFMIIGYKCKENAVLLPVYLFILEITVLKFRDKTARDGVVVGLFSTGVLVVFALIAYKFWQNPDWITSEYRHRYYSIQERLMTEFRALVFYIYQILAPSNRQLSLWHDDFGISMGLLSPKTTVLSLLTLLAIFAGAIFSLKRLPLLSLGILWFFVSHSLESTVFALELVHEHRNYLASFGILLGITALMTHLLGDRRVIFFVIAMALFVAFSMGLQRRASAWSNDFSHVEFEARNRPNSAIAAFQLGKHYYNAAMHGVAGAEDLALPLLTKAASNDRYTIVPELLLVILSEHENVDYQQEWLHRAAEKIKKYPYMNPSKSAVHGFFRCLKGAKCGPPVADVEQFFDAILISGDSNLQTSAAFYFTEVNVDHQRAERAFKLALSNNSLNWVNYISFLLHANKIDEACEAYKKLEANIRQNKIRNTILYLERLNDFDRELGDC